METIMTQTADWSTRELVDITNALTPDQMRAALHYVSGYSPEAFAAAVAAVMGYATERATRAAA